MMQNNLAREGTGLELIINAAESCLQIGVTANEKLLAFQEWFEPCKAAETLTWALDGICRRCGISPATFRRIACINGPGSFTGIRLALSTAAALRRCGHAMLGALDYMQALATTAAMNLYLLHARKIWVLTHARRDLVHARAYMSFGPLIPSQPVCGITLQSPQRALEMVAEDDCYVCGSALVRYPRIFEPSWANFARCAGPRFLPTITRPAPGALCLLARHADYFDEDVMPMYARDCDAVENLSAVAEKMGRDPAEAAQKLRSLLSGEPGKNTDA